VAILLFEQLIVKEGDAFGIANISDAKSGGEPSFNKRSAAPPAIRLPSRIC
jgi:hypothetical protein